MLRQVILGLETSGKYIGINLSTVSCSLVNAVSCWVVKLLANHGCKKEKKSDFDIVDVDICKMLASKEHKKVKTLEWETRGEERRERHWSR